MIKAPDRTGTGDIVSLVVYWSKTGHWSGASMCVEVAGKLWGKSSKNMNTNLQTPSTNPTQPLLKFLKCPCYKPSHQPLHKPLTRNPQKTTTNRMGAGIGVDFCQF